jgi:hypothetical protein
MKFGNRPSFGCFSKWALATISLETTQKFVSTCLGTFRQLRHPLKLESLRKSRASRMRLLGIAQNYQVFAGFAG